MNFFKNEILKNKYNYGIYTTILFPIIISFLIFFYLFFSYDQQQLSINDMNVNPWIFLLGRYVLPLYSLMFPILVSILAQATYDIEHKNNNFKLLFTLPVQRTFICYIKIVIPIVVILISVLIAYILFLGMGLLLGNICPNYNFISYNSTDIILLYYLKLLISLITILLLQLAFSVYLKSFVVPVGGATFFTFISIFFMNKEKFVEFVPYYSPYKAMIEFNEGVLFFDLYNYLNIGYIFLLLCLNIFLYKKMEV